MKFSNLILSKDNFLFVKIFAIIDTFNIKVIHNILIQSFESLKIIFNFFLFKILDLIDLYLSLFKYIRKYFDK